VEPGACAAVGAAEAACSADRGEAWLGRIGVLGTAGTVASGAYERAVGQHCTRYEVVAQAAPLLVPLVEEGWLEGEVPRLAVRRYVEPLIAAGVSVIVLGCTHYPLLESLVVRTAAELAGRPIEVVDSARATARTVVEHLRQRRIAPSPAAVDAESRLELLVTDQPAGFQAVASRFLGGYHASVVRQVDIDPVGD
jgi:glutamate racemase